MVLLPVSLRSLTFQFRTLIFIWSWICSTCPPPPPPSVLFPLELMSHLSLPYSKTILFLPVLFPLVSESARLFCSIRRTIPSISDSKPTALTPKTLQALSKTALVDLEVSINVVLLIWEEPAESSSCQGRDSVARGEINICVAY